MKTKLHAILFAALILGAITIAFAHYFSSRQAVLQNDSSKSLSAKNAESATANEQRIRIEQLPLSFEINRGQASGDFDFISRNTGQALYLAPDKAVIALPKNEPARNALTAKTETENLQIELLGANPQAKAAGVGELPATSNYLLGNDSREWQTQIAHYSKAQFSEVYPGVDVVYYGNQQKLEYDFIVKPGAAPDSIKLKFDGAQALELDEAGNLIAKLASKEIKHHAPVIYQEIDGAKTPVSGRFVLHSEDEVGFEIGAYDKNANLVIDPVLVYSTYIGGAAGDLFSFEGAFKIFLDAAGNVYIAGATPSGNFPTRDPFQPSAGGTGDCFVTKLNQNGTDLIFSTYLGGSGADACRGLFVDGAGNIYVAGNTDSSNFPILNPFQSINNGNGDVFVTKLDSLGRNLIFSTYLGGFGGESVADVRVDAGGSIYVGGTTGSENFPTLNAIQPSNAGSSDGFFTKFNPAGNTLAYSTYYGGSVTDAGQGFATDAQGNAYLTGVTNSRDLRISAGAFQTVKSGTDDAFVAKLNTNGGFVYGTYFGGNGIDNAGDVVADSFGNATITGFTRSLNLPRRNAFQPQRQGDVDSFVSKLSADGRSLIFSTFLGGSELERGVGLAVDGDNNVYTTGRTNSGDFPLRKPVQDFAGLDDIYVVKFSPEGALIFSTPLGGDSNDLGTELAADNAGNVYVTGTADQGLRTTAGAYQPASAGGTDAFVAKINTISRTVRSDFDGDRISDIAVFRPSNGFWYILNSSNNSFRAVQFGASDDRPVPGDYDGDGKTDVAVFRPSSSAWYWLRSSDNQFSAVSWGSSGDKPVQGDYDADGITDVAVFRPSIGFWLILNSSDSSIRSQQFGSAEDRPVPGDYDGDEQTDLAFFKPSNQTWSIARSFTGLKTQQFGLSTDLATPADYDGDGKDDVGVFRPSNGFWYLNLSRDNSFLGEQFGASGDVPVPGDYDGDRRTDLAVYRNGTWFIRQSSTGAFRAVQFGLSGDIPIPATYQPQQ